MKDLYEKEKASLIMNLRGMGITNNKILNCIENIPREIFIEPSLRKHAWENIAIPLGMGQTISQPYIVALMTNELNLNGRELVLEIGTGSGYQSAILSNLCRRVYSIETIQKLYNTANTNFDKLGILNITTKLGDGSEGWPAVSPFDAIIVTCASKNSSQKLISQLKKDGILIIPEEDEFGSQTLIRYKLNNNENIEKKILCNVKFVPMV